MEFTELTVLSFFRAEVEVKARAERFNGFEGFSAKAISISSELTTLAFFREVLERLSDVKASFTVVCVRLVRRRAVGRSFSSKSWRLTNWSIRSAFLSRIFTYCMCRKGLNSN